MSKIFTVLADNHWSLCFSHYIKIHSLWQSRTVSRHMLSNTIIVRFIILAMKERIYYGIIRRHQKGNCRIIDIDITPGSGYVRISTFPGTFQPQQRLIFASGKFHVPYPLPTGRERYDYRQTGEGRKKEGTGLLSFRRNRYGVLGRSPERILRHL